MFSFYIIYEIRFLGHTIQPCIENYTEDKCKPCSVGFVQPDYIQSTNDSSLTECFKNQNVDTCRARGIYSIFSTCLWSDGGMWTLICTWGRIRRDRLGECIHQFTLGNSSVLTLVNETVPVVFFKGRK